VPGASVAIGQKNLLVALCLKCLNLKYIFEFDCLPTDKVWATKQAWFAVVLQMILKKTWLSQQSWQEKTILVNRLAHGGRWIALRTVSRLIINANR
jgi:hypothetical protein